MRDSAFAKVAAKAAPFLDPGEKVLHAVPGFEGPRAMMFFGLLGAMFVNPFLVVVTDLHVYLFNAGRFSALTPKSAAEKHDIKAVVLGFDRSVPFNRLTVSSPQRQTSRRLWIAKLSGKGAAAAAAAVESRNDL